MHGSTIVCLCCSRSVETVISIQHNEESAFSTLHIKTLDRPGLLVEIVKVLKDINVNVISAEVRPAAPWPAALCCTFRLQLVPCMPLLCCWLHDPSRQIRVQLPSSSAVLCFAIVGATPAVLAVSSLPAVEMRVLQHCGLVVDQVDTEGRIASDSFFVTYHGEPLNQSMVQLVTNALQVGLIWIYHFSAF